MKKSFFLIIATLLIVSCSSYFKPYKIAPDKLILRDNNIVDLALDDVEIFELNRNLPVKIFRNAVEKTLRETKIFNPNSKHKAKVNIKRLFIKDRNTLGMVFSYKIVGIYELVAPNKKSLYEVKITSIGKATDVDRFYPNPRKELALQKALRNNIAEFRKKLIGFLKNENNAYWIVRKIKNR